MMTDLLFKKMLIALLFLGATCSPVLAEDLTPEQWPKTIDDAVTLTISLLTEEDVKTLRETPRNDLIKFHHGWGTGIRNAYGLWRGNTELLESACEQRCHPDEAAMVIIEKVWETVQTQALQAEPLL